MSETTNIYINEYTCTVNVYVEEINLSYLDLKIKYDKLIESLTETGETLTTSTGEILIIPLENTLTTSKGDVLTTITEETLTT